MEKEVQELIKEVEKHALAMIEEGQRHCMKSSAQGQVQIIAIDSARKAFLYASERFDILADQMKQMTLQLEALADEIHGKRK